MLPSPSAAHLYRDAMRAALLGLGINLALGLVKLAGGIRGDSFALVSDAVNSFGDVFASLVVLLALWVAQQPADEEHPYGHTRAEAIAGSNVALLIILSALWIAWQALERLTMPHDVPAVWTLWIAGGNAVIKETLYRYKVYVARRLGSSSLMANAWDHRADALCSLAVLVGIALVRWGGEAFLPADEIASLVVVAAIVWSGWHLFRSSTSELMDVQASDELVRQVRSAAEAVPEVAAVEKLWVRKTGLEYLVDIHLQVDARLPVAEGHRIGHLVKDELIAQFPTVRDVLVHLEPFPHDHEQPPHGR